MVLETIESNPHSPTIPVAGLFFIHPDHLGVSAGSHLKWRKARSLLGRPSGRRGAAMITDGYGNPVSGGEYGGKSHISYKPYGEILRTDSGGPDITKFKYTGQIEDKETGLMYYKARYYDPMVARFTQADSMVFNDQVSGMNRYMYVSGNPIKYIDPSGHRQTRGWLGGLIHDFNRSGLRQDIAKHVLAQTVADISGNSPTLGFLLNAWGQKSIHKMRKHKGIRNDLLKGVNALVNVFLFSMTPLSTVFMIGQGVGALEGRPQSMRFTRGGVVITGNGFMGKTEGVAFGNIAFTGGGDKETIKHEAAHIAQFNEMGFLRYYSHLGSSPYNALVGGPTPFYENDANRRAGTFGAYDASNFYRTYLFLAVYGRFISNPNTTNLNEVFMYEYFLRKGMI